jgi:hypothetical protein
VIKAVALFALFAVCFGCWRSFLVVPSKHRPRRARSVTVPPKAERDNAERVSDEGVRYFEWEISKQL